MLFQQILYVIIEHALVIAVVFLFAHTFANLETRYSALRLMAKPWYDHDAYTLTLFLRYNRLIFKYIC